MHPQIALGIKNDTRKIVCDESLRMKQDHEYKIDVYNSQAPPESVLKKAVGNKNAFSLDNLQCSKRHFIFMYNELLRCFTDHFAHGLYLILNLMMYMKVFYEQNCYADFSHYENNDE